MTSVDFICKQCGLEYRIEESVPFNPLSFMKRTKKEETIKFRCSCTPKKIDPYSYYLGYCKSRETVPKICIYEYKDLCFISSHFGDSTYLPLRSHSVSK